MALTHRFNQVKMDRSRKIRQALEMTIILTRGNSRELVQNTSTVLGDFNAEEQNAFSKLGTMLGNLG